MFSSRNLSLVTAGALALELLSGCSRDPLNDLTITDRPMPQKPVAESVETIPWVRNGDLTLFYFNSAWPKNLRQFCAEHPNLSIEDISKVSEVGYSHTEKVMIYTQEKSEPSHTQITAFEFDSTWPASLRDYLAAHPNERFTASFAASEGGYSYVRSMLVVTEAAGTNALSVQK